MAAQPAQLSLCRRRITAVILFAGCVGLGAAASEALRSSFVGSPAETAVVSVLTALLFVFFALGGYALAANVLRGPEGEASRAAAPASLLEWCASCGEVIADQLSCPLCRHPQFEQKNRWVSNGLGPAGSMMIALVCIVLLSLGIGIAAGPAMGGERRVTVLVLLAALGLLIVFFSGAMLFATLRELADGLRGIRAWHYKANLATHGARCSVDATARTRGAQTLKLKGSTVIEAGAAEPMGVTFESIAAQRPLASTIRALHQLGLGQLWFETKILWSVNQAASALAQREMSTELMVSFAASSQGLVLEEPVHHALAWLSARAASPAKVASLWPLVAGDERFSKSLEVFKGSAADPLERTLLAALGRALAQ